MVRMSGGDNQSVDLAPLQERKNLECTIQTRSFTSSQWASRSVIVRVTTFEAVDPPFLPGERIVWLPHAETTDGRTRIDRASRVVDRHT